MKRLIATALLSAAGLMLAESPITKMYQFGAYEYDAAFPNGALVEGPDGALYGVTFSGGAFGTGTLFKLMPVGAGWTESIMHSFDINSDGGNPTGPVTLGLDGTIYGTCMFTSTKPGGGTAYSVGPDGTFTLLHTFDTADGLNPSQTSALLDGTIYGTTVTGGSNGFGTIWSIAEGAFAVLYNFTGPDNPVSGLITDGVTLYGTTGSTIFSYAPGDSGPAVLHEFQAGWNNSGALATAKGALYGMTGTGGKNGEGLAYMLDIGSAVLTHLASFREAPNKWSGGIAIDLAGNAYGALTARAFSLAPTAGRWEYEAVHTFHHRAEVQSFQPISSGRICGLAHSGGLYNQGYFYCLNAE